jgi:hypothetical protein
MFCVNFIAEIQTLFIEKTITNKILKHMKKTLLMLVVIFISLYSHSQSPFLNFRIPEESNKRIIGYSSSNKIDVFFEYKISTL